MQSSKDLSTKIFDEALAQSPSFDKNMMHNVLTENQLIDTISNLEKQIAAIPQGQSIPDQHTYFLECFNAELKKNRGNRHAMCLHLDQKIAETEDKQFAALTQHGFFFNIEVSDDTSTHDQDAIAFILERGIREKVLPVFLQAVIDGDEEKVAELLDKNPELLMVRPPKNLVIESKRTWHRFNAEDALLMAVKRKQLEMIKLLLPYYDKLEQTEEVINAKEQALSAWSFYEMRMIYQYEYEDEEEIIIPREYVSYADALFEVFSRETFPNGVPGENGNPWYMRLSDETELALTSLFNKLLPEKAVNADYLDVELALLAAYQALFQLGSSQEQHDAFWNRVILPIHSILSPDTAKILCEPLGDSDNLDDVVTEFLAEHNKLAIEARAVVQKLKDGTFYYRDSRLSHSAVGLEYLSGFSCIAFAFEGLLRTHMLIKRSEFSECYAAVAAKARPISSRAG